MDRYWEANSATDAPAVPASNAGGFPTDGSLPAAVAPTTPGAWWFHSITEELRNAIAALGASPDFTKTDQLAQALLAALAHTALSIHYDDLIGAPHLAAVATSGSFTDLSNVPAIQSPLGFTPVQQGTGAGQLANTVRIGWDGGGLRATVDATDEGRFVFESELQADIASLQNNINTVSNAVGDLHNQVGSAWTPGNLQPLNVNGIGYVAFIVLNGNSSQSATEGTVMALPGRPGSWLSSGDAGSGGDYWCVWTRIA